MIDKRDKIRLNRALKKEKKKRTIYTNWAVEIKHRMEEGSCPKCGFLNWIKRGSGFHKKWICDKCGLTVTKRDWIGIKKGFGIWWDYLKKYAIDENARIKKAKRKSQSVRNYEKDNV
jgi:predicted RNA-binding Zn-ribbon protein involved in translation (DUF1610 family)